jgi:DNA repair protein RadC
MSLRPSVVSKILAVAAEPLPETVETPRFKYGIKDMPESERPREKLEQYGPMACSDAELIAILLRTGREGASAVDIGRELIRHFGSLEALKRTGVSQLSEVLGIGPAKAVQLAAAFALGDRLARESIQRERLDTAADVERLLGPEMRGLEKESLRVLLLDARLGLIRMEEISRGSANETVAHPREILRPVIVHNAYGFILVHNHPSGDPAPSSPDLKMTIQLRDVCRQLLITFRDHIILGAPAPGRASYYSFREAGKLD